MLVDAEPGMPVKTESVKLEKGKKLVRCRFESVDEAVDWLNQHPEVLVELTMVTPTFLSASDRKRLQQSHQGLISLIPEVTGSENTRQNGSNIDLTQDLESLFVQYFQHRTSQQPSNELLNLFKEIRAEQTEE